MAEQLARAEPWSFAARWRRTLLQPHQLVVAPVVAVLWLGQRAGVVAAVPLWLLAVLVFTAQLATSIVFSMSPARSCTSRHVALRAGVEIGAITVVIYATGWGPTLAIGYCFGAADVIRVSGARATKAAIAWALLGLLGGQVAIATGLAPTLIGAPLVHGLAGIAGLGAVIVIGFLGWVTQENERLEGELSHQAYHDALTGLANRAAFVDRLEAALAWPDDGARLVAVLFTDLDRFKLVNDSLGHNAGDRLLVEVATRLRACMRPGDLVARFGGDEFTVLLQSLRSPVDAHRVADRIGAALRAPVVVGGRELVVTTSVGVALAQPGTESAGDVLRNADLAMYLAKERGRGRWEVFDPTSAPSVAERLEVESALWRAVDRGELVVYFQPEVSLRRGGVVALEALVRWQHPTRGLLLPAAFVPLAEESSLIVAIDRYVLGRACRQASEWRRRGRDVLMSVNVSPRFLRQLDVVDDVGAILAAAGLPAGSLQLEITERTAVSDEEHMAETLQRLRRRGVRIAIDDFGTGYSSFEYLKRFPVDVLKLDRTFVESMDALPADAAIAQAVITMGHALGLTITAEGVERPEQAAQLRSLGCDAAQGFHFARPMPTDRVEELLADFERAVDRAGAPSSSRGAR